MCHALNPSFLSLYLGVTQLMSRRPMPDLEEYEGPRRQYHGTVSCARDPSLPTPRYGVCGSRCVYPVGCLPEHVTRVGEPY